MPEKVILVCLGLILCVGSSGQAVNYSEDIAPIIYENCTGCHWTGGIAPFPLESYQDATMYGGLISFVVSNGIMPPWPPDTLYHRYSQERILLQNEISAIVNWVDNGMIRGDSLLEPELPQFQATSTLGTPDLKLQIPSYTSAAIGGDSYVCFSLPTGLSTDKYIKAVEVIPGNRQIVHHALMYIDTTGISQTDTSGACMGVSDSKLVTGYVPGATPTIFPDLDTTRMGVLLEAGDKIVLQIHYPEGSQGMVDSTSVNIYFYPDSITDVREVYSSPVLQNWLLWIPANTISNFNAVYPLIGNIPVDISVLSVFPHMHLLGKSIEAYAVHAASGDTTPFVRINDWDFEWQGFYYFKNVLKLPAGNKIYGHAQYDNTVNNPHNPNNPPQLVTAGEATTDEMFLVYFHYSLYEPGDENINLDSILKATAVKTPDWQMPEKILSAVYPNPFNQSTTIAYHLPKKSNVRLGIYDLYGKEVELIVDKVQLAGFHKKTYQQKNTLPAGLYLYRITASDQSSQGKLFYID